MTGAHPAAFGRYRVIAPLGAGAMGTVYLAHDPLIDRKVAVKVIRVGALPAAEREAYLERFQSEARAGGRCQHPGLVAIHDAGEVGGVPYLVMEYVDGVNLQAAMADLRQRDSLDAVAITLDMLEALGSAHAEGIVHRDVKPANLLLRAGRVKITDFGIARLDLGQATAIGDMLGTPSYMAPEQARGEMVDHRADLFSVACVLHAILTGRPPFAGRSVPDTVFRLTAGAEADLSALAGGPHADLAPVLRCGLAKDPTARFATAAEFAAALRSRDVADATRVVSFRAKQTEDIGVLPPEVPPEVVDSAIARLATYIGPIAQHNAVRAARRNATVAAFHAELAEAIPDQRDARRFLREVGQAPACDPATSGATGERPDRTSPPGLSTEARAMLRDSLAVHLGPIADVLIRRAVCNAGTLDELVAALAAQIHDHASAEAFRAAVRAALHLPG